MPGRTRNAGVLPDPPEAVTEAFSAGSAELKLNVPLSGDWITKLTEPGGIALIVTVKLALVVLPEASVAR